MATRAKVIDDEMRSKIIRFSQVGASVKGIANRFGVAEGEIENILKVHQKAQEKADGLSRYTPAFQAWFRPQWKEVTKLVMKGLRKA